MANALNRVLKEPLCHFLGLGFALFVLYAAFAETPSAADSKTLAVDRDQLLTFMQYRSKAFDREKSNAQLDAMPAQLRTRLINDYVEEETLYREAKALQLDKNDYVARQRLVQQMRYLTQRYIDVNLSFTEDELRAYKNDHAERYLEPAKATFTHVFVSTAERSAENANHLAQKLLRSLNENDVPFHQSMAHGERFLYHRNYVNKEADLIASHFGEALQQSIFSAPVNEDQWQGPFPSDYGFHLVLLTQRHAEYLPPLDEVLARVKQDIHQQRQQTQLKKAIARMSDAYNLSLIHISEPTRPY